MLKQQRYSAKAQLQLFANPDLQAVDSPADNRDAGGFAARNSTGSGKLWLCIYFPDLSLEALGSPRKFPAAILIDRDGHTAVLACNDAATAAGVLPGMALNAALALVPSLDIRQRREAAERELLQACANWALAYTPVVSLDTEGSLLLEVAGSLKLFGGLDSLSKRLRVEMDACGYRVQLASAPVARAALWLARSGRQEACRTKHELVSVLADLPVACLEWPVNVQQQLLQMGIRTLGECKRLPRAGFARRIGPGYLLELDQGFGSAPDLLQHYQSAENFHDGLEVMPESLVAGEISGVLYELCERLAVFLRRRQVYAQQLSVRLEHCSREPTEFTVSLRQPNTAIEHFFELIQLHLDKLVLPAAVSGVELDAKTVPLPNNTVLAGATDCMLPNGGVGNPGVLQEKLNNLIERLRARLGAQQVHGLDVVPEHRPERAWAVADLSAPRARHPLPGRIISRGRPLWLFATPRRMASGNSGPFKSNGKLALLSDAERIESGWWDGHDVRRDYYVAIDGQGSRLWVYQDHTDSGWYWHGLFG